MKKLHPNIMIIFYLRDLFWTAIIYTVITSLLLFFNAPLFWKLLGFNPESGSPYSFFDGVYIIYLLAITFLWPVIEIYLEYKYFQYQIDKDKIIIQKGIINKKQTTIPFNNIQNIDINRPVHYRILGLAELHIQTAGEEKSLVESVLPGIEPTEATEIKNHIFSKISQ